LETKNPNSQTDLRHCCERPNYSYLLPTATADCSCLPISPANEVNNFHAIIFLQHSLRPITSPHDVLIQFDGYSLGCEVQISDQFIEGEIGYNFAVFPIY
jgi:hypothetical protein